MDLDNDIKWKSVGSTPREISYFCHKITGQQKWTTKNCYCSKPKGLLQPTLPCCSKKNSLNSTDQAGLTEHNHATRETRLPNALLTKKLYSLSDIVIEVHKSFLVKRPKTNFYKGKRKRKKPIKNKNGLNFKNYIVSDVITTKGPIIDVNTTKGPISDVNTTNGPISDVNTTKGPIIDVITTKGPISDINTTNGPITDVNTTKDSRNDVNTTKDSSNDVDITRDSRNYVDTTNNFKDDVNYAINLPDNDVKAAKDSKNEVDVTEDTKKGVTNDSSNDVIAIKDSKHNVSTAENPKTDVLLRVKDENPSKTEEKVLTNEKILKRKREVDDNVNEYKGRLRVHRNRIAIACRRKYRRRNAESGQSAKVDTNDPSGKEEKLELGDKTLHERCDLIEQSIIEIVQFTSNYSCSESSEASPGRIENVAENSGTNFNSSQNPASPEPGSTEKNQVVCPRFVNEKFIQMNKPFDASAKVSNKELSKAKLAGSVEKKEPVSKRNHLRKSSTDVSPNSTSKRPATAQTNSNSALNSFDFVPIMTQSSSSLTQSVSGADSESSQTGTHIVKTEQSSNRNQSKRPLHTIVKGLKNKNADVAVSLTSTVSKMRWSTILAKETKKIEKSNDTEERNLNTDCSSLNPEQGGQLISPNDIGNDCQESEASVFGHIKETFSLAGISDTLSKKPVSIAAFGSAGCTHFSETRGSQNVDPFNKVDRGVGTSDMTISRFQTPADLARGVTEVPASFVDLSWRIVTSNDGHSASLNNFFKLVPVFISRGPNGIVDKQVPVSFLGVPVHGGPQVIAKILKTSMAENCNEVFRVPCKPIVSTRGMCTKKMTLSFVWDDDVVLVESDLMNAGGLSGKDVKPRPPIWIDLSNKISMVLPKPLRLPVAGSCIYLGDFNVKSYFVEFVVTHSVMVTISPRPSLTIPSGTPMTSNSSVGQTTRCRSPGETRNDVQTARVVPISKKKPKEDVKKRKEYEKKRKEEEKAFIKCVFCGKILRCRKDVKLHRKLHVSFIGTKCSECKRRFHNGGRLSVHIVTHKCHWHHHCERCQKTYRTPKFLTAEDLSKDYYKLCLSCRRRELKCKKCPKRCLTFEDLDIHFKATHGIKCPICQGCFLGKRDLSQHMKNQHDIASLPPPSNTCI